ncbi:MAG TPA: hypothetical protein PKE55_02165 [Kiritimatiellia bacterium]|nr:hypothetical protein [Kiritimatiellia bacterium]
MLFLILLLVGFGCAIALYNWRWGIALAIGVALIQDPLRKLVPGAPGYLAMASVPVWCCALLAGNLMGPVKVRPFLNAFPKLAQWLAWFGVYLLIPTVLSATYGAGTWKITGLGMVIYGLAFFALLAGWYYGDRPGAITRLLMFYAVATSIMLIGGLLELRGSHWAVVGTSALDHLWVTHRTGEAVYMMAGFFRGPDIMGWHGSLVVMVATIMAARTKGTIRLVWIAIAVWGLFNVWICGRRKMLAMLLVFLGTYTFVVFATRNIKRALVILGVTLVVAGLGWYGIATINPDRALMSFHLTTLDEWSQQVRMHGFDSVGETLRQAGFLGYGLGMSQQGIHHIAAEKPRLWQESGPTKLMAELGVPGMLLFLVLVWVFFRTAVEILRVTREWNAFSLSAGLVAVLVANAATAVVSAQVYGDPFVALFLAVLAGMLLSEVRRISEAGGVG